MSLVAQIKFSFIASYQLIFLKIKMLKSVNQNNKNSENIKIQQIDFYLKSR